MAPPKAKYVEPILHGLKNQNNFNEIVHCLSERLNMNVWTIVYKSLIVIHLMIDTDKMCLEYFSNNLQIFQLTKIMNSSKWSNNDIIVLKRYDDYLKGKCFEYGDLNEQIEILDSEYRHDKDLKQLKKLLEVESLEREIKLLIKNTLSPQDLQNDLLFYAFKLLIQDLLESYNKLNEGVITLLESFFDLSYANAERTLNTYKSFVKLTDYVVKYLKIGKAMGLDIPVIKHITTKLIQSLEDYLDNQKRDKKKLDDTIRSNNDAKTNVPTNTLTTTTSNNRNDNDDNVSSPLIRNNESTVKNTKEQLERIREQKKILERQLQQEQQVLITPTLPTNFTGTNPFSPSPIINNNINSFTFEQQQQQPIITANNTSNPFLVQTPVISASTGFYATNQNVVPAYTGAGFGGYSQQPVHLNNTTTGNTNPFILNSIVEEPSVVPTLDPQQQIATAGITYLPVQVTQYAVVNTNPFEQTQEQEQHPHQQQQQQQQQQQHNDVNGNDDVTDNDDDDDDD
ncbi:hypothetical protein RI543_002972 [Arxiozyma heterogenica]|uniref:ENTH domain-containing protein n=1 Tax=Arxiozyma heterogenica TaxID=278026 RepID=A0AAN8A6P4_9SACH|nr:hypothetical protein RI543_002972 [Kazachstania heterogenica]